MATGGFAVTLTPTTDSSGAFRLAGVREQRGRWPVSRERRLSPRPDVPSEITHVRASPEAPMAIPARGLAGHAARFWCALAVENPLSHHLELLAHSHPTPRRRVRCVPNCIVCASGIRKTVSGSTPAA